MLKTTISWILVGAFGFVWWWLAHRWSYLHSAGNQWTSVFILFTLISLAVLIRHPRTAGAGLLDGVLNSVKAIAVVLPWMILAVVVLRVVAWLVTSAPDDPVDHF